MPKKQKNKQNKKETKNQTTNKNNQFQNTSQKLNESLNHPQPQNWPQNQTNLPQQYQFQNQPQPQNSIQNQLIFPQQHQFQNQQQPQKTPQNQTNLPQEYQFQNQPQPKNPFQNQSIFPQEYQFQNQPQPQNPIQNQSNFPQQHQFKNNTQRHTTNHTHQSQNPISNHTLNQSRTQGQNHNHNHIDNYYLEDIDMPEERPYPKENKDLIQENILVDKQLIKLKISEEYTNDMLGRALSKAEYYSSRFGKKNIDNKKFNYYNRFDNGLNKEKENLLKSFINSLDTLQDYYEVDGENKRFPSNFKQKDIIKYIENLRDNCCNNDPNKKYFNIFIEIIKGEKKVNFGNFINTENASVNPNVLVTSGISSIKFVRRQEKEWKEKAEKNGDYPVELKVGIDWNNNKHISDDMKYIDNYY